MRVKEMIAELKKIPGDYEVFFDTLDTEYFKQLMDLFGRSVNYPDGHIDAVENDQESRIAWLKMQ